MLCASCRRRCRPWPRPAGETGTSTSAREEIVAEKLRAILQHVEKFEERGWSRWRARDHYDLWRALETYRNRMDLSDFASFLREKCAVRNVAFAGPEDFFQDRMLAYVEKTWHQWLGPLVPGLPTFQTVIGDLRPQIAELVPGGQQPSGHAKALVRIQSTPPAGARPSAARPGASDERALPGRASSSRRASRCSSSRSAT